jgi:hypothetical protein
MGSLARLTRTLLGVGLLLTAALPAGANEIAARSTAAGLRIHGPDEVLRDFCRHDEDGSLWLVIPGGATWELVTSTMDGAMANPGDGEFHPFDEAEVRAALAQVRYPLDDLAADVYLLPYPRRGALDSGAGPGLVLLSPGVAPIAAAQQHAEFVHELGHVVQYRWMPDSDERWTDYRSRRGISDASVYSATSVHANRPHEIFAEDFRALFGGALATYSGSIENSTLQPPATVTGLDGFFRALVATAPIAARLVAANPARGAVTFALAQSIAAPLDLFDVSGRRVATLEPAASGVQTVWRWSGRDAAGRAAGAGVLMAKVRGSDRAALRISWMP